MRAQPIHALYILMRTDLDSMNTGKGIAQGSHATDAFRYDVEVSDNKSEKHQHRGLVDAWRNVSYQGFGTVLTLGVDERQMRDVVELFQELDYYSNIVHDDTYPVSDGAITHLIPLDTCGYVFVPHKEENNIAALILRRFGLHP